jgi:hypothetical protein
VCEGEDLVCLFPTAAWGCVCVLQCSVSESGVMSLCRARSGTFTAPPPPLGAVVGSRDRLVAWFPFWPIQPVKMTHVHTPKISKLFAIVRQHVFPLDWRSWHCQVVSAFKRCTCPRGCETVSVVCVL